MSTSRQHKNQSEGTTVELSMEEPGPGYILAQRLQHEHELAQHSKQEAKEAVNLYLIIVGGVLTIIATLNGLVGSIPLFPNNQTPRNATSPSPTATVIATTSTPTSSDQNSVTPTNTQLGGQQNEPAVPGAIISLFLFFVFIVGLLTLGRLLADYETWSICANATNSIRKHQLSDYTTLKSLATVNITVQPWNTWWYQVWVVSLINSLVFFVALVFLRFFNRAGLNLQIAVYGGPIALMAQIAWIYTQYIEIRKKLVA